MNIVFDSAITSVLLDNAEIFVYAGSCDGQIYQVNLNAKPAQNEQYITDEDSSEVLCGHSKQVTCLALSLDGSVLASGSHDASVKLWDVPSQQCTKTLQYKGPVTNVLILTKPQGLEVSSDSEEVLSRLQPVQTFQRHLHDPSNDSDNGAAISMRLNDTFSEDSFSSFDLLYCADHEENTDTYSCRTYNDVLHLRKQLTDLRAINKQLYYTAFEKNANCKRTLKAQ